MSAIIDHEKQEREVTFGEKQTFAVMCLRALADCIESGQTIIDGFECNRDVLNTGVQKLGDEHYVKTHVCGPLRIPAFTIYHVVNREVHQ